MSSSIDKFVNYTQKQEQATFTKDKTKSSYTLDDVVNVAETGSIKQNNSNSNNKTYMDKATELYNQSVDANNKFANNQAAAAYSEYNELNRNVNEINKANGRANTGYAGDTSIEAYNAYRNSVNAAYSEADATNNQLYSYYLSEIAKDREYNDEKETKVVSELEGIIADGNIYSNGYIASETAEKAMAYATNIYGGNIPEGVKAYLEKQDGFKQWLENSEAYTENYADNFIFLDNMSLVHDKTGEGNTVSDEDGDDFYLNYDGEYYELETRRAYLTNSEIEAINKNLPLQQGSMCVFKGKLYIRSETGDIREAVGRDRDYTQSNKLLEKVKEKQKKS